MLELFLYAVAPILCALHCYLTFHFFHRIETLEKSLIEVMGNNIERDRVMNNLQQEIEAMKNKYERI